jgi:C6 transcription factor Pro1
LTTHLVRLETGSAEARENVSLLDISPPPNHGPLVSCVWSHAALIYLSVVVSGWQPANVDIRYHVCQAVGLLNQTSPQMLRTMAWPFCVAGCFATPAQEPHFRGMVEVLQPPSLFGTIYRALDIMQNVWSNRDEDADRDLASCFRNQGDLVLLV